jgi:hypothetical protein
MKSPLETFLARSLKEFQKHLEAQGIKRVDLRVHGAELFALFLLGRPPEKHQRVKGTV